MANIYIGNNAEQFEKGVNATVDRVIVYVNDEQAYYSPSGLTDAQWNAMTGKIVSITIPFGTQAIADNIRTNLSAVTYKSYTATCGDLDPAGELGDYISIAGEYSLLANQVIYLNDRATSDFSAKTENVVTDKYPYLSSIEQEVSRSLADVTSRLTVAEGEIDLRVEKSGVISAINQSAEAITISANKINLTGYVTFSALSTSGSTAINGDNITTGTITADRIGTGTLTIGDTYTNGVITMKKGSNNTRAEMGINSSGGMYFVNELDYISLSAESYIRLSTAGYLDMTSVAGCMILSTYMYGSTAPSSRFASPQTGQLYFQI